MCIRVERFSPSSLAKEKHSFSTHHLNIRYRLQSNPAITDVIWKILLLSTREMDLGNQNLIFVIGILLSSLDALKRGVTVSVGQLHSIPSPPFFSAPDMKTSSQTSSLTSSPTNFPSFPQNTNQALFDIVFS